MSPALSVPVRHAAARAALRLVLGLMPVGLLLLAPRAGLADGNPAGLARLRAALAAGLAGPADALALTWTQGQDGALKRLVVDLASGGGKARAERCAPDCAPLGTALTLSAGEQAMVLSGLRSLELDSLRSSDEAAVADRALELSIGGSEVGRWQRARSDWPAPPSGEGGLQPVLDELLGRIERAATARRPVAIPKTAAELSGLRLKLQLSPSRHPGGVVIVESGRVHVIPEEGSLARVPRPREHERPLSPEEESRILAGLSAIDWERIDAQVPRRAQPAIGDDDGRLATLHLLPAEPAAAQAVVRKIGGAPGTAPAAPAVTATAADQPRGLKRYVADLQRSAAAPLLSQLVSMLTAQPAAPGPAARPQRGAK